MGLGLGLGLGLKLGVGLGLRLEGYRAAGAKQCIVPSRASDAAEVAAVKRAASAAV